MDELDVRIGELFTSDGKINCAQTVMSLSLEMRGESNFGLIKALGALGGGFQCRKTCGALLGGCCAIASYGAKGEVGGEESFEYKPLVTALAEWFENEFGGTDCKDLVIYEPIYTLEFCPGLVRKTFLKCVELLEEANIDPYE